MRRGARTRAICIASLVVVAAALTAAVGSAGRARASASRPNIVFILTDDLSNNLVPYMPHVLQLAHAGTSFSRYYVVDSLCCPSRASIFTGEYPHDDGVYTNAGADGGYNTFVRHNDPQKSFAVTLRAAGYRTAIMGKFLNGYTV